ALARHDEAPDTNTPRAGGPTISPKPVMPEPATGMPAAPPAMPANYNALKGYAMNPYDPRRDPRDATFDGRQALATGGSSSGVGTAANLWAANIGTETSGSLLSPANPTMLVTIQPTVGRL